MYIVKINNIDKSCHTYEADAIAQKARFILAGYAENTVTIIEAATFSPQED